MTDQAADDSTTHCSNADCRVAETGKCIEGLDLANCPNYGLQAEDNDTAVTPDLAESAAPLNVGLPHGDLLDASEAGKQLLRGDSRVIAILGPRDAGKTSLIAGLFDLFQVQQIGDIKFAGSTTLHAFERACHDARLSSRRDIPHMERTRRGEVKFYHLDVAGGTAEDRITLLLADRAGEEYRSVADDVTNAADLLEVHRADTLAILVDGNRLLDDGKRHNVKSDIALILQGLADGGAITATQRVALILTKYDIVTPSPKRERVERDFDALHKHLAKVLPNQTNSIQVFRVAASPQTVEMARGEGLAALLNFWLQRGPQPTCVPPAYPSYERAIARLQPIEEEEA